MKTYVYVDGFNLYHRALKGTRYKWLDLNALAAAVLPATSSIDRINYYTARVSAVISPTAPGKQLQYLDALETLPNLHIHRSRFLAKPRMARVRWPIENYSPRSAKPDPGLKFIEIERAEEKGTDVKIGAHLVRDALQGRFEQAALITNDTDLTEPVRIVVQEVGLPVILLTPTNKAARDLQEAASSVRHIQGYLSGAQFPDTITAANGETITKPADW